MKIHTRRAVAYIATRIVTMSKSSAIYDYSQSRYFNFDGVIQENIVEVFDYTLSKYISGSGSGSGGSFSLYHYGNRAYISLDVIGESFSGYDYHTRKYFSGTVSANAISLYDYEERKYFNFSV